MKHIEWEYYEGPGINVWLSEDGSLHLDCDDSEYSIVIPAEKAKELAERIIDLHGGDLRPRLTPG